MGSINENLVFNHNLQNPDSRNAPVETIMLDALPFVDVTTPLEELSKMLSDSRSAVLVKDFKANANFIITKYDVVQAIAK